MLTNASLHLGHGLLAALQRVLFSFITSVLSVLHLRFKKFLVPLQSHSKLLLLPELISQPGSIDHSTLGLVLRHASLADHLVQVVAHGAHLLLALHLGTADRLVGASLIAQRLVGVGKLLLNHATVAVGLLKQGSCLLQSILVGVGAPVSGDEAVGGGGLGSALFLEPLLNTPDVPLDQADVALALSIGCIGVLKSDPKVNNVRIQLLLHAESLNLALSLCLQGHLHALNSLAKVLPGGGKLLLLLGNPPLNFLFHLGQLQRSTENLVLLLLKGSLGFREGGFQFHLLGLQPLPDFVNLVDGASTLADLVHDILDLVGEELVFPADLLELDDRLVVGILDAEQLG